MTTKHTNPHPQTSASKIIAVDFDGTCCEAKWPSIGGDIGAAPVLHELVENSHRLILYTLRDGDDLLQAIKWFGERSINLWAIQRHPEQNQMRLQPNLLFNSPKCACDYFIDDRAIGAPLIYPTHSEIWDQTPKKEPYIDWVAMRRLLVNTGLIS
jgi:hypothetical protein